MGKAYLNQNVYEAALERIHKIFDDFEKVCVSFSGGKDSTVLLHLTLQVARERRRTPVHVLFIDMEAQYKATIEHVETMLNHPDVIPYWICLPLNLRNAVSVFEPHWCCWDPEKKDLWVRPLPEHPAVISDPDYFPFFRHRMEFEEFTPVFQEWLAGDSSLACLIGIRTDESFNRYLTIARNRKSRHKNLSWTRINSEKTCNGYPIYDWRVEDIWTYIGKNNLPYNKLYDYMYWAGKSIHEMRIYQPYGDDQRKGLDQFHKIEPDTWFRIVRRVPGANYGSIYSGQKFLGYYRGLGLPKGHTWESYTQLLLETLPEASRLHYLQKFETFIKWWKTRGGWKGAIPDEGPRELESKKKCPSWRRMAMCILKNDFWCRSLSFSMTKDVYGQYYQKLNHSSQTAVSLQAIKQKYAEL